MYSFKGGEGGWRGGGYVDHQHWQQLFQISGYRHVEMWSGLVNQSSFPWWPIELITGSFRSSGCCLALTPGMPVKEFLALQMALQPPALTFLLYNPSTAFAPISQALYFALFLIDLSEPRKNQWTPLSFTNMTLQPCTHLHAAVKTVSHWRAHGILNEDQRSVVVSEVSLRPKREWSRHPF